MIYVVMNYIVTACIVMAHVFDERGTVRLPVERREVTVERYLYARYRRQHNVAVRCQRDVSVDGMHVAVR